VGRALRSFAGVPAIEETFFMKSKKLLMATVILTIALLYSCTIMVKGDVYIGYGWDPYISEFYDSNPTIYYNNIVEDVYYKSETGSYWGSYRNALGWYYSFEYTLSADYASAQDYYGPYDSYFYIYLDDFGPTVYVPVYSRSLSTAKSPGRLLPKSAAAVNAPPAAVENPGEPAGIIERSANGYTMRLKYWKVE
jgi:hypothetical protein